MRITGTPLSSHSSVSSAGAPFGNLPLAPKAMENGASPSLRSSDFSSGTLSCSPRAASKLAHKTNTGSDSRCCHPRLRREFQRLGVNLPLQGRPGPWEKEGATGSEGARKRTADVGVGWSPAGPDSESKHPWGGRGGGPQGSSPSAAVGRLTPEERAVGGIS